MSTTIDPAVLQQLVAQAVKQLKQMVPMDRGVLFLTVHMAYLIRWEKPSTHLLQHKGASFPDTDATRNMV